MQKTFYSHKNLLPYQGEVFLFNQFFTPAECENFYNQLLHKIEWRQEPIRIFGKEVMQPRLTAWYGNSDKAYTYSGITMLPLPFTTALQAIKEKIEPVAQNIFNSALLNLYRHGADSMGWHRDNEKELGVNPVIASVSFGAARVFKIRHYKNKREQRTIELTSGSFLLMAGETQHHWEHQITKTSKKVAPRINITFRLIQ